MFFSQIVGWIGAIIEAPSVSKFSMDFSWSFAAAESWIESVHHGNLRGANFRMPVSPKENSRPYLLVN